MGMTFQIYSAKFVFMLIFKNRVLAFEYFLFVVINQYDEERKKKV